MTNLKLDRVLELFLRGLRGENLSAKKLADEYHVSSRSITRDISSLEDFLADHRDLLGNAYLEYSHSDHTCQLVLDEFLTNKELLAMIKCLIGTRAFSKEELLKIIGKLKKYTTVNDRAKFNKIVNNETYCYKEIHFDCQSVIDLIYDLTEYINTCRKITITYNKMSRETVKRKICPLAIMFSEYYFYLIASIDGDEENVPRYFRIDRIIGIVCHRENFSKTLDFNEGELRNLSQFMWPGKRQKVVFEFTGPSYQAILDKLHTAKILSIHNGVYTIEADVYGDGIKMYLLSQGSWVKVISPQSFVEEMKDEIRKMNNLYEKGGEENG